MREIDRDITYGKETISLVLQFSGKEQDPMILQREVREILIAALQEQMKNRTP